MRILKHLPNFLTCCNLLAGALGCLAIVKGQPLVAFYYVLIAGLFDFFDGFAARWLKVHSPMGKELDSLADVISFGLLPSFYLMQLYAEREESVLPPAIGLLIVVFSALRLAKFNIDTRQSDLFLGLPVPANAIAITSLSFLPSAITTHPVFLLAITLISCFLLVSEIPLMALKFKNYGWAHNKSKYLFLIAVGLLLSLTGAQGIPFVIPLYILVSVIGNVTIKSNI